MSVKDKALGGLDRSRLAITEGNYHSANRPSDGLELERRLFGLVRDFGAHYVGQQQKGVIELALGGLDAEAADPLYGLRGYVSPSLQNQELIQLMESQAKAFSRIDEWVRYLGTRSAVIGTRIHGNILSLQAETPSLPVVHDLRTRELTETLGFPTVGVDEVVSANSSSEVLDLVERAYGNFDAGEADSRRSDIARIFSSAIKAIGLTPSSRLLNIAR